MSVGWNHTLLSNGLFGRVCFFAVHNILQQLYNIGKITIGKQMMTSIYYMQ